MKELSNNILRQMEVNFLGEEKEDSDIKIYIMKRNVQYSSTPVLCDGNCIDCPADPKCATDDELFDFNESIYHSRR